MDLIYWNWQAKDQQGNALSCWNDPDVGIMRPVIQWEHPLYGCILIRCDTEAAVFRLFEALQHVIDIDIERCGLCAQVEQG